MKKNTPFCIANPLRRLVGHLMLPLAAFACVEASGATPASDEQVYDARIRGREVLTPQAPLSPRLTGPSVFGVRPGKPLRFHVSATGKKPVGFSATGLPAGVEIDPATGWITGRAPRQAGDVRVVLQAKNTEGESVRELTIRIGDTICLTPPMGWNSWYVHSEGVSEDAIRETAVAMNEKGLTDHGWTYLNIDDCWMGERDPETKAIQPNDKFRDMKALVGFVNSKGLMLGLYSTPWMSTYAGYIGGSAPNEAADYSAFYLPPAERQNPHQLFGHYPNGIRKGLARIGDVWFVDRDARQFAEWGIDYVKYDWKEWTLKKSDKGWAPDPQKSERKTEASGIARRVYDDFRAVDRDIVISLSPDHDETEDRFIPRYANLWRLTPDIHAEWSRLLAPFAMEKRLQLTGPGRYGDLDMLQIGPMGKPNRAETVFKPSPLTPAEQYFQVTLWCVLTQPLLLSCHVPSMDDFDLGLVTNDEVLAVNQDALCSQGRRLAHEPGAWEIWAKDLADGSRAVAFFNLGGEDRVLRISRELLGRSGAVRDLWRQRDLGTVSGELSVSVSPHGAALLSVKP